MLAHALELFYVFLSYIMVVNLLTLKAPSVVQEHLSCF
jgi:hypothetical protein